MTEKESLQQLNRAAARIWQIAPAEEADETALAHLLAARIYELLETDVSALMQILYRIDVPELRFEEAMTASTVEAQAEKLAALCIERERLKIETRERYRQRADDH